MWTAWNRVCMENKDLAQLQRCDSLVIHVATGNSLSGPISVKAGNQHIARHIKVQAKHMDSSPDMN